MKRGGTIFAALLLLMCGCTSLPPDHRPPQDLAGWQALARQRHLSGESASRLERWQQLAANDRRRQELPDLLQFIRKAPQEQAVELGVNILRESIAIASIRLIPENETLLSVATQLCGGELDCLSATMLAEKSSLDNEIWKQPDDAAREKELQREITSMFGRLPLPEGSVLPMPQPLPATAMPEIIRKNYGDSPAAMLKLSNVILAMPGEFARMLIADPDAKVTGIWLEARYHAAVCAVSFTEKELNAAYLAYRSEPSQKNLFRWRKWFFQRNLALSAIPLVRGSESDIRTLEAMLQLHNYL